MITPADLSGAGPLSFREALSGIMGSISLVSWVFLLVPQIIENYKNGSAEGLSVVFITIWLLGDIANLIGAFWGHLLSTVVVLAVYFSISDAVLLGQTIYYSHITKVLAARRGFRQRSPVPANPHDPTQPLLARPRRKSSGAKSRHRRSSARRPDSLSAILEKRTSARATVLRNALAILGVCLAGTLGWFIAWKSGAWSATGTDGDGKDMPRGAEMLGYLSAVLYLGARIPQIIRNHQNKSCEGLSLLFFLLSLLGNLTYGAGILCHSSDTTYVRDNLPWLLGSLGTMFQDAIIFAQFHIYSGSSAESSRVESAVI